TRQLAPRSFMIVAATSSRCTKWNGFSSELSNAPASEPLQSVADRTDVSRLILQHPRAPFGPPMDLSRAGLDPEPREGVAHGSLRAPKSTPGSRRKPRWNKVGTVTTMSEAAKVCLINAVAASV